MPQSQNMDDGLDFLETEEKRAAAEERMRTEVASNHDGDESTENVVDTTSTTNTAAGIHGTTGTNITATTATANTNNVTKTKAQRFTWKYAIAKQQSFGLQNKSKIINPFLNDNNLQDLYFSEKVIAAAPYRAKHGETQNCYNTIVNDLIQKVHSDGTIPLQKLSEFSAKCRVNAYLNLAEQWKTSSDDDGNTTGALFHDGTSPNKNMYDKGYNGMTVKEKIMFNVEYIIDEVAKKKNDKLEEENDKVLIMLLHWCHYNRERLGNLLNQLLLLLQLVMVLKRNKR